MTLPLTHFFRATMVKADVGNRIDDFFSIQFQDDAQHAMRAGMLRPYLEEKEVGAVAAVSHAPVLRAKPHCFALFRSAGLVRA